MKDVHKANKSTKLSAMLYLEGDVKALRSKAISSIDSGIDTLYFPDHLDGGGNALSGTNRNWHAMWPALLDVAIRHEHINVGTMVASAILRSPQQLALDASSVAEVIGNDRFKLTIGAGGAKSDLSILGVSKNTTELSQDFENYLDIFSKLLDSNNPILRLPKIIDFRIASESTSTIGLVSLHQKDWVTTGGWKKHLSQRVIQIDKLWELLTEKNARPNVSVLIDRNDGITLDSTPEEINSFASIFKCPIQELILPV